MNSMSQATLDYSARGNAADDGAVSDYRELSRSAVLAVVFAVLGLFAWLHPVFIIIPLLGILFGGLAILAIRKYPEELVGGRAATIGLLVSALTLAGSVGRHAWVYATEVPEGHVRVSFAELAQNPRTTLPWAKRAEELDGQKVFIRGYVKLDRKKTNLTSFLLVGSFGACCFGGSPKITEVVGVRIVSDETTSHSYFPRGVAGTFRLIRDAIPTDDEQVPQVFYVIEADTVR